MARRKYSALKTLMYEKEITQRDVAERTGYKQATLSSRFQGAYPWDTEMMEKVAAVLDIPIDQWLTYFYEGPARDNTHAV